MTIAEELQSLFRARDGERCRYCQLSQYGQGARFHIDHIQPKKQGGKSVMSNLALLCPHCNLHKASKVSAVDPVSGTSVELFHPLRHVWHEHLLLQHDGICRGISPVGRATVDALVMNDELAVVARYLQIQSGVLGPTEQQRN